MSQTHYSVSNKISEDSVQSSTSEEIFSDAFKKLHLNNDSEDNTDDLIYLTDSSSSEDATDNDKKLKRSKKSDRGDKKSDDSSENTDSEEKDWDLIFDVLERDSDTQMSNSLKNLREQMTSSNEKVKAIEKENAVLVQTILSQNKKQFKRDRGTAAIQIASSAINRKNDQRKIDRENQILLRKIQNVKSSGLNSQKSTYSRLKF